MRTASLNSVELFAGAGGLALGIERARFQHLAVLEKAQIACNTLSKNTSWPIVCCDVATFDYAKIEDKVDLVAGGPPCQPFSVAGKHLANLDPRDMFPEAVRAVRELRPRAFLFENVKGLLRTSFSNYLDYILLQLRHPDVLLRPKEDWTKHRTRLQRHETGGGKVGLNYNVVSQVLNAADYGTSQRRERFFIVGLRSDLGIEWSFPPPTHALDSLLWSQWKSGDYWRHHDIAAPLHYQIPPNLVLRGRQLDGPPLAKPWRTIRDAISDLPDPQQSLQAHIPGHAFVDGAKIYKGHTGSPLDLPAKTLKAGVHGVPGGENMLLHPNGNVRYFTIRECARLQGFPDSHIFPESWGATMRQLGNAVPVDLAYQIGRSLASALSKSKTVR